MRITLIGPLPPPHGGIASHVGRMAEFLATEGHQVEVLSPFGSQAPGHAKTHILKLPFALARRKGGGLRHWHLTGWHRLLVMALCERLLPGKAFYTLHVDLDRVGPPAGLLRWMLKPLGCVVCVKEEDARSMIQRRVHSRVVAIPAFVPNARKPLEEPELCAWLQDHSPGLLFMASHWGLVKGEATYGFDLLLKSLAGLESDLPGLGLLALVPPEEMPESQARLVQQSMATLGEKLRVVRRPVSLEAVLPAADLLVRPTRTDGDALSVREAQALGIPVLASDCAPRPEPCHLFASGSADALRHELLAVLRAGARRGADLGEDPGRYAHALLAEYRRLGEASTWN